MWMAHFLLAFLTVKSRIHQSSTSSDKDPSAELLLSIEEKLSSAFRELARLQRMSKLLSEPENYHRVTRVTQIDKGDHYQVNLEYIPDSIKPKVYVSAYNGAPFRGLNVRDYGTVTADFPKAQPPTSPGRQRSNDDTIALVTFDFPTGVQFSLELDLGSYKYTHDLNNSTSMDVPRVLMSVDLPEAEAVSSDQARERTPRVDIVLWIEENVASARWMGVRFGFRVASDEDDDLNSFSSWEIPPVDLKNVHTDERDGYRHWAAVIHSGKGHPYPEGKLEVYPEVYFHCSTRCLVRSYHGTPRSVAIRRGLGGRGDTELRVSQLLAWKSVSGDGA